MTSLSASPSFADIHVTADDRPVRSAARGRKAKQPKKSGAAPRSGKAKSIWSRFFAKKPNMRRSGGKKTGGNGDKGGKGKKRFGLRWFFGWALTLAIWGLIAIFGIVVYYCYDMPNPESMATATRRPSVTLISADGQTVAAYGDVYGESLELKEITPWLPAAVLATEDRRFYSHYALDPIGLSRAIVTNIRAGRMVQGGSTITQQLAKNLFLTSERSLKRKVQELVVALWLEHKFTKAQILTLYLNRVYLGNGTWGMDAAARRYFDASARNLNLYQSALLAGLLKAPSRYNPQNNVELSYQRTSQVLANMVAAGAISQQEADAALKDGPDTVKRISHTGLYFADWVHDRVDPYTAEGRDIVVRTTLDMALQTKAEVILESMLSDAGAKGDATQGAIVVMSPNGAVRAMAGGRQYSQSQFNRAVQSLRQPGSSFKPMVWLTAVENGWRPEDLVQDSPIVIGKYRPSNYSNKYEGPISLSQALAKSSNVVAVRLIEDVGPRKVIQTAQRLGISSTLRPESSLALGASEVSLLEMTAAFAAFANDGYAASPHAYATINDPAGGPIFQRQDPSFGRVIARPALAAMTEMLSGVITNGTGRSASIGRPAGGKSGTTQDYRDAWFVGFTADYVCGVWIGNDNNSPMKNVTGGSLPAKVWRDVMIAAHQGLPVSPLPGSLPVAADNADGGPTILTPPSRPSVEEQPQSEDSIWDNLVKILGG